MVLNVDVRRKIDLVTGLLAAEESLHLIQTRHQSLNIGSCFSPVSLKNLIGAPRHLVTLSTVCQILLFHSSGVHDRNVRKALVANVGSLALHPSVPCPGEPRNFVKSASSRDHFSGFSWVSRRPYAFCAHPRLVQLSPNSASVCLQPGTRRLNNGLHFLLVLQWTPCRQDRSGYPRPRFRDLGLHPAYATMVFAGGVSNAVSVPAASSAWRRWTSRAMSWISSPSFCASAWARSSLIISA